MNGENNNTVHFKNDEDMNTWQPIKLPADENNDDKTIKNEPQAKSLKDFDQWRITKEKNIPQPEPTITIGGAAIASPGNITGISAAAKAGKTAFTGVLLAGAISQTGDIDGFNDVEVIPNSQGRAVIHFDTEQSEADQQYFVNTILRRAKIESTPDYYRSYNIRQLNIDNYREVTDNICELSCTAFNGVHLIVIDGGADYITSVNDESAAYNIVQYYTHLSIRYNCPVIIIVHLNPGSDKERGHFGSEVQRKCYGLLTVSKEGDISTVQPKIMRKAGNGEIPLVHFAYSKEQGYHVQVDLPDKAEAKAFKEMERLQTIAEKIFVPPACYRFTDAISKIMKHTGRAQSTAKTMLNNMAGFGFIEQGEDKNYRLKMNDVAPTQNE
ncbi:hypothetical protein [Ferruginibacter sp.]|nr:AAA family ATPase [Ferruginibacter sp.]